MSETRVAVIGAGYFGQFHYDAWDRMDDCRLVGLTALEGAEAVAKQFRIPAFDDVDALLAATSPDLVDITAPPPAHLPLISSLAGRVPWIICQKPFCLDLEQAQDAIRAAEEAGARLAVHENVRFQPWYRVVRGLMDDGLIGPVWHVTFRLRPGDGQGPDAYLDRQPYFQKMERFLVHETAIHWIDTFRYLLGEPKAVFADLRQLNPVISGEDAGIVQLDFGDGIRGLFDGNRLSDHAADNCRLTMGEMEVEGPIGSLRLDGSARIWHRAHGASYWCRIQYDWQDRNFGGDCVFLTNRAILSAFRAGDAAETEAAAYVRNLEIEAAAYESHAQRRWIDV